MTDSVGAKEDTFLDFLFNEDPYNLERVGGPVKPILIVVVYLIFVKFLGPFLMKDVRAFKLKTAMIVYNFSLVILNMYVAFHLFRHLVDGWIKIGPCGWGHADSYTREYTIKVYKYLWMYYISKYIDLFDTVFFVLRKKQNQITFLHIFHHALMILCVWYTCRYEGKGITISVSYGVNALVHVIMYGYYGIAACGPEMQRFIHPWKKYLTLSQITQFIIIEIFIVGCARNPEFMRIVWFFFVGSLIILFSNFYIKTYSKREKKTS